MNRSIAYTIVFTFVTTFVIAGVLSFAAMWTKPIVENNELARYQGAVLRAMDIHEESQQRVFDRYATLIREGTGIYTTEIDNARRIAKVFSGPGVWGEIRGVVGYDPVEQRVITIEILDHRETPGLGGRVAGAPFLDQFRGERISGTGITVVTRGPGNYYPNDAAVDGITGATGTTRAFDTIINTTLQSLVN